MAVCLSLGFLVKFYNHISLHQMTHEILTKEILEISSLEDWVQIDTVILFDLRTNSDQYNHVLYRVQKYNYHFYCV